MEQQTLILLVSLGVLNLVTMIYTLAALRMASRERAATQREVFGLLRKIEGLTAHRREQVLNRFDAIVEELLKRVPSSIASQSSEALFQIQSSVLTRLSELEPNYKDDAEAQARINRLIQTMESFDTSVMRLVSEAIRSILLEQRAELIERELQTSDAA